MKKYSLYLIVEKSVRSCQNLSSLHSASENFHVKFPERLFCNLSVGLLALENDTQNYSKRSAGQCQADTIGEEDKSLLEVHA